MDKHRLVLLNNSLPVSRKTRAPRECVMIPHAAAPRKLRQEDTDYETSLDYLSMLFFKTNRHTKQNKPKPKQNQIKKSRPKIKTSKNTKQINEQMSYQAMKRHRRFQEVFVYSGALLEGLYVQV